MKESRRSNTNATWPNRFKYSDFLCRIRSQEGFITPKIIKQNNSTCHHKLLGIAETSQALPEGCVLTVNNNNIIGRIRQRSQITRGFKISRLREIKRMMKNIYAMSEAFV